MSSDKLTLYWGDLHNHNAVGYARGSLERSIGLAREHLDFFAFTGHASWHDIPQMPGDRHEKWFRGFDVHTKHWPKTRELIKEANSGSFAAFLGYEWHSSEYGDYHLVFPEDQPDLYLPDHVEKLLDFAKKKGALAVPHHVGYKQGWRGMNWKYFDPDVSPVAEIFSEHGCTATTILYQLARGLRFGFVASTDDHLGYPGAYGEGLVGAWAESLKPASIFEAIKRRRTVAVTGDRISLDFTLNGQPMGTEMPYTEERRMEVGVEGQDSVEVIELVRKGKIIERYFPEDHISDPISLPGRFKCRLQYGWGPWAVLDLGRICEWDIVIRIRGGRFVTAQRCFQAGPYNETLRDRLRVVSENTMELRSFTSREGCYAEDPTKSVILELEANPDAELTLEMEKPVKLNKNVKLRDLIEKNVVEMTGVMTSESFIVHRLAAPEEYSARITWTDRQSDESRSDWYFVRVKQHNGHLAWSSPIWVG